MPPYLSPGVYIEEVPSGSRSIEGVATAVAAFVGLAEKGPSNKPTLVSNWSQFTKEFGSFVEGAFLAHAVYAYFMNEGGNCWIVKIGDDVASAAAAPANGNGNGSGPRALTAGAEGVLGGYRVQAKEAGPAGAELSVEVEDAGGDAPAEDAFKIVVKRGGQTVDEIDGVSTARGAQNVVTRVNAISKLVRFDEPAGAVERPKTGTSVTLALTGAPAAAPVPAVRLSVEDYVGDVSDRSGFGGLETVDEVTMIAVPDLMSAYQQGSLDIAAVKAVQVGVIAHCEMMGDRMAILDTPPNLNAQQVKEWRAEVNYDSEFATVYWPWVQVYDPRLKTNVFVPPSGHVAGIWGRSDGTRGVHKAPANEVVRGALSLEIQITRNEHDLLNPVGINCLRTFPGRGTRVWGARTLSSDPSWRYINVRRLFNYLEESILGGTDWVVFEPNDPALWGRIRRTINAFLINEWRKGALFGLTPEQAFYVRCDEETNPAESIDLGQVVCEIGVAPVKPAEFVIFRLSQFSGGTSLVSE